MEYRHKVLLYIFGALQELKDCGLIHYNAGAYITPSGTANYDQIKASGFQPTVEDLDSALPAMAEKGYVGTDTLKSLSLLILNLDESVAWAETKTRGMK